MYRGDVHVRLSPSPEIALSKSRRARDRVTNDNGHTPYDASCCAQIELVILYYSKSTVFVFLRCTLYTSPISTSLLNDNVRRRAYAQSAPCCGCPKEVNSTHKAFH